MLIDSYDQSIQLKRKPTRSSWSWLGRMVDCGEEEGVITARRDSGLGRLAAAVFLCFARGV